MTNYPTIPLPNRRRMMFPNVIPIDEDGDVSQPTIRQGPSVRMGNVMSMDNRIGSPLEQPVVGPGAQMERNIEASVPQINAQSRMAPDAQDDYVEQPVVRGRMAVPYEPPEMPDHSQDAPRGFWGNVKHRLEHAGKGLLLGRGIGGAVLGAISPRMVDRTEYEQRTRPEYDAQWKGQQGAFEAEQEGRQREGLLTGVDPDTGQPTEPARARMEGEKQRRQNQLNLDTYRNRQLSRQQKRDNERAFNDKVKPGNLTDEQVQDFADQYEIDIPDGYNQRQHVLKLNNAGQYVAVDKATGMDSSGKSVTSFDATKQKSLEKFRQAMIDTGAFNAQTGRMNAGTSAANAAQRIVEHEAGQLKSATEFETKASEFDQQAAVMETGKQENGQPYPPEMAQAARAAAKGLREQAKGMRAKPQGTVITRSQYNEAVRALGKPAADAEIQRRKLEIKEE